ncbi:3-hydroxybenzoate 6-hydroxylase 1 [Cyphellophora attinorum]|uniref:3-hydroxybenzoate 6-hydroxylase 1 n=1 Tax=Cyphellophora attinorum TaxID=1664694 RepID=A0A0N0NKN0_9EURO|nr:3-hydroxybenzoate 6-hydroxylase 1 [Phialophora attinorum]KPI38029.1 3-hydroxybenzoate 6-hydroxylase 1 [Phialophora attinorum]
MVVVSSSGISGAVKRSGPAQSSQPQIIKPRQKIQRDASTKLNIIIVGAGLGGVGAAIGLLLGGHDVTILESAPQIAEVGAGIQVLPNASRLLQEWGMKEALDRYSTAPSHVNMLGWKGNTITRMSTEDSAKLYPGTAYWDFHRANLHKCLVERAEELGAKLVVNSKVANVVAKEEGAQCFLKTVQSGKRIS